jgi:hypothetical protein
VTVSPDSTTSARPEPRSHLVERAAHVVRQRYLAPTVATARRSRPSDLGRILASLSCAPCSRGLAAALRGGVLPFAAMLDLGGPARPRAPGALIHSILRQLGRSIVVANATGTRIGRKEPKSLFARCSRNCCQPCPDAYARRRRVVRPAVRGPRERRSLENSLTFH